MSKVYEVEANIILRFNFEVDASNEAGAEKEARKTMQDYINRSRREFDESEIEVEYVTESEGHND